MERIEQAMAICAGFQRCMNYPKDENGVIALAQGLLRASDITQISMQRIVDECLQSSMYCPTDADLLSVARDLRGPSKAEDVPVPSQEMVRKQWQALARYFPHIMENGTQWHAEFKSVCAKIKLKMGSEKWWSSTTREKVRVGIEMGMKVYVQPPPKHTIDDMGLGIFVERRKL